MALEVLAGNLEGYETRILDLKAQEETLADVISEFNPQVVGFTCLTCEANTVLRLSREVKNWKRDITVVVGGIHVGNDPNFFNHSAIDYVVIGLGKASFRDLVSALEENKSPLTIPGVAKTNPSGNLSFIPRQYSREDLVESSAPRFDLVDKYRNHYIIQSLQMNMGFVATAFGCPNNCSFCSLAHIIGSRYLTHSTDCVIRDIKLLGNIPIIRLVDANTFGNAQRAKELCQALAKANFQKHFIIDACADTVVQYPDLFREWKQIGLHTVIIGFEEINNILLSEWKKKNTVSIISQAIKILHDLDISMVGDFIVSPDYSEENFQELARFVEENKVQLPVFTVLTPLPGTPLYESKKNKIVIHDLDYYTLTNAVTLTKIPEKEFYSLLTDLTTRFYSKATL